MVKCYFDQQLIGLPGKTLVIVDELVKPFDEHNSSNPGFRRNLYPITCDIMHDTRLIFAESRGDSPLLPPPPSPPLPPSYHHLNGSRKRKERRKNIYVRTILHVYSCILSFHYKPVLAEKKSVDAARNVSVQWQ